MTSPSSNRSASEEAGCSLPLTRSIAQLQSDLTAAQSEIASLRLLVQEGREGATAVREAAKIACLDLNDAYREASEAHMRASNVTKAREAMDWAIGAIECAHAIGKLPLATPVPETQEAGDGR